MKKLKDTEKVISKETCDTISVSSVPGSITTTIPSLSDRITGISIGSLYHPTEITADTLRSVSSIRTISSSLADTAAHLSEDIHILLDEEYETYKKDKEDKKIYQETYAKWFPYETLSPESFKKIPKRIIREYIIASFSTYLSFLHSLPKDYRQVTKTTVNFFKSQFAQFDIQIPEIDLRLSDDFPEDPTFVEAIINILTSGEEEE